LVALQTIDLLVDGVSPGVDVARYPDLSWNISTAPISVSPSIVFDIEFQAAGFTDFDDINKIRLIRRQGTAVDISNQWILQGGTN